MVKAVDDISLEALPGETLGIVGESGSGKSVTSLTVMRLLPELTARVTASQIQFLDQDLLDIPKSEMCQIRGKDVAMIFQEPMTSLNPSLRWVNRWRRPFDSTKMRPKNKHVPEPSNCSTKSAFPTRKFGSIAIHIK